MSEHPNGPVDADGDGLPDDLGWDRDRDGRMADYATDPIDEPYTVCEGDEEGED